MKKLQKSEWIIFLIFIHVVQLPCETEHDNSKDLGVNNYLNILPAHRLKQVSSDAIQAKSYINNIGIMSSQNINIIISDTIRKTLYIFEICHYI